MAQDKTVKIAIVVDKPSLDLAKNAIAEITKQVENLVKMTKDLGGIFGGPGGAKATAVAGQPGTSASTQAQHSGGRNANPFAGMARGAQETGTSIRSFGEITTKTFKSSEEAMRRLVDAQDTQVRRSQGIMERFRRILTGSATGGGAPAAGGGGGGTMQNILSQFGGAGSAGGGAGGGIMGMLGGRGPGFMNALGRFAPAAAVAAAVNFGATTSSSGYLSNLEFQLARPMINTTAGAGIGGAFGGQALAYRHGDLARSVSMDEMVKGKDRAWFDTQMKKAKGELNEKRAADTPLTFREHYTKEGGGIGGVYGATKNILGSTGGMIANYWRSQSVGGFFKGMGRLVTGGDITDMAMLNPDMQARIKNLSISAAAEKEMQNKILEQKIQKDPLRAELFNTMYAGSLSDLSMARGAGISGGLTRDGKSDTVQNFRQHALNMQRSEAEIIGARQGMGSIAGQGFFYRGDSMLSAQAGGLHNATNIFGLGQMFGGVDLLGRRGAGGLRGMQGLIGQRGRATGRTSLDIAAGGRIGDIMGGEMLSGSFQGGSGGLGLLNTLAGSAFTGGSGADMRLANMTQMGLAASDRYTSGGADALQKAVNFGMAMQTAPGAKYQTQLELSDLNTASQLDIVKSGKVSAGLAAAGVTSDMVKEYHDLQNKALFARITEDENDMLTPRQAKAVAAWRAQGAASLKGLSKKELEERLWDLGQAFRLNDRSVSPDAAYKMFRDRGAAIGALGKGPRGRGAGDSVSRRSARAAMNVQKGKEEGKKGTEIAEHDKAIREGTKTMGEKRGAEEQGRQTALAGLDAGGVTGAIEGVAQAMQNFVAQLRGEFGGSGGTVTAPSAGQ